MPWRDAKPSLFSDMLGGLDEPGEAHLATKSDFTADEWKLLLQSPLIAGVAVSAAEPSGLIGMMRESTASARALIQATTDPNADALVKAVASEFETSEGRGLAQEGVKAAISGAKHPGRNRLEGARRLEGIAASVLDAKGGADALPFKTWLAAESPSRSPKPRRKAAFLASAGRRSARRKRRRSLRSPRRLACPRRRCRPP